MVNKSVCIRFKIEILIVLLFCVVCFGNTKKYSYLNWIEMRERIGCLTWNHTWGYTFKLACKNTQDFCMCFYHSQIHNKSSTNPIVFRTLWTVLLCIFPVITHRSLYGYCIYADGSCETWMQKLLLLPPYHTYSLESFNSLSTHTKTQPHSRKKEIKQCIRTNLWGNSTQKEHKSYTHLLKTYITTHHRERGSDDA